MHLGERRRCISADGTLVLLAGITKIGPSFSKRDNLLTRPLTGWLRQNSENSSGTDEDCAFGKLSGLRFCWI